MKRTHAPLDNKGDQSATTALLLCQRRWQVAFANPLLGVALCDLDGGPLDGNPALERLVGYTLDELRASPEPLATHPDDRAANLAAFHAVAAGQRDQADCTKRYVHRDGTVIWCHVLLALVRHPDGSPDHVVALVLDITAQIRAEQTLRAQQLALSPMELAILPLLANPNLTSYPQIGARLSRSGETVRKHAQHIAEKLGLPTAARAEIVRAARGRGLLDLASPILPDENG